MARATKCRRQPLGAGGRTPPPAQALACGRICRRSPQVRRTADATAARCRSSAGGRARCQRLRLPSLGELGKRDRLRLSRVPPPPVPECLGTGVRSR
ncbi:hypothetical protein SETIT_4G116000v2 [Setaria italica]|uniref:Uncharacterized protein n=1 Tax=Setaria italica TaxID=4555 RepID=A0A368QT67_SETIT|nr:hypothetical protein SETIT_4G116000v2 [Setaria italica]